MEPVLEMPDNAISENQSVTLEDRVEENVEGDNFAIRADMIANLPTKRTIGRKEPNTLCNNPGLARQI